MRNLQYICLVLLIAMAAGCIPSQSLPEGEIDRYWYLQADAWPQAKRQTLKLAGKQLPSRWVFRQEPSLIWSTVSIVRAIDKLEEGSEEFNAAVSPAHASMMLTVLSDLRTTLEDLREIADPDTPKTPEKWAAAVAEVLVLSEKVSRAATTEESRTDDNKKADDPLGWSAGPMIQMLTAYLNERSGGNLLAGMEPDQVGQLRQVMVQVVLRGSFAAAGKQDSPALRETIIKMMRQAKSPETLEKSLAETLLKEAEQAPPAKSGSQLRKLLSGTFAIAPRIIEMLEMFIKQWDCVDSMLIEFRYDKDQPIVSVTLKIKPGRQLRLANLSFMQPAIVFRGGTRITIQPTETHTEETVVLFTPLKGGRSEVRFEGVLYGLVRLLALPLDNAALREVRVLSASGPNGRLTSVTILMDATGSRKDPRRIMTFQDVRTTRVLRTAFEIRKLTPKTEQIFNYITPSRRYTYRRTKTSNSPKGPR